jgi:hypothetical protein
MVVPVLAIGIAATVVDRPVAWGEPTRELRIQGPKEVFEGDPVSAGLTATGRIVPGTDLRPRVKTVPSPITRVARGGDGVLYVGTTDGLFRADAEGGVERVPESESGAVTALTATEDGVMVGVSPAGILQRVRSGRAEAVAALEVEYVWGVAERGRSVYVVTGAPGRLVRIDGERQRVLYESKETHLRALALRPDQVLFAGGSQGVVYQWKGDAVRALYDSELEEATALAVRSDGSVVVSLVSAQRKPGLPPFSYVPNVGDEKDDEKKPFKGSEVVRILPSGRVEVMWRSQLEGALDLAVVDGEALVATGGPNSRQGRVYAVDGRGQVRLAARVEAPLATSLHASPEGLLIGTGPVGGVLERTSVLRASSVYRSSEQDFQRVGRVGRIRFDADVPSGTEVSLRIRTGNTKEADDTWGPWSKECRSAAGCAVSVAQGRFAQFEVQLRADGERSPEVRSLHASVVRLNEPPSLFEVFALDRGIVMAPLPVDEERDKTVTLSRGALEGLRPFRQEKEPRQRVRQTRREGFQTVAWHAADTNGDELMYSVQLRPVDGDGPWVLLKDQWTLPFWSFDGRAFADGRYVARVSASDRPSNPPVESLTAELESQPFLIDNGPPTIRSLLAQRSGDAVRVQAQARDGHSALARAEISIDGGPWMMMTAEDGMVDSPQERLTVEIVDPKAEVVSVRVVDEAENVASRTTTVRGR